MADPVIHFEIVSKDAKASQAFYKTVFSWNIDASNATSLKLESVSGYDWYERFRETDNDYTPDVLFEAAWFSRNPDQLSFWSPLGALFSWAFMDHLSPAALAESRSWRIDR